MHSTLLRGRVRHQRLKPKSHAFSYGLYLLYLDLEELPKLLRSHWLCSLERPNLISFRRSDFLGDPAQTLREAVLERVESELGRRPQGRLGMVTQLRTLGYLFNPVSFYFCHDQAGQLDAIVAEITNTPWAERHAYVLDAKQGLQPDGSSHFELSKSFHVSPFFPMQQRYRWQFHWGPEQLQVRMTSHEATGKAFEVSLACAARPISTRTLVLALLVFPLQPLRLHAAIYWQAARLFLKRTPFFTHPKKLASQPKAPL